MDRANGVLMVFCKAPIAGEVKTRLQPVLTPGQCAKLHAELIERTLAWCTLQNQWHVQLWVSPRLNHPFFEQMQSTYAITLKLQQGDDLGQRMHEAFCVALRDYQHAVIIGTDCPSLTLQDVHEAFSALQQGCDVVLSPAEDGGYVLVGLNQPNSELFQGMDWGTSAVLTQTLQRIQALTCKYQLLKTQWDVDVPVDLQRYYRL